MGSDIVFVFAWLPFVLAGAAGQPALDNRPPRPVRLRRRGRIPVPVRVHGGPAMTRRAAVLQALGFTGALTALLAGAGVLLRGDPPPVASASAGGGAPPQPIAASAEVAPGDSLAFVSPADGTAGLLVRDADGTVAALGAVCTHAGCDVVWRNGEVICPCHDSTFDLRTGEPLSGPATVALPVLPVSERGGEILLG
jgi:thiosulfate dehydrogenase [quinone] large subunit